MKKREKIGKPSVIIAVPFIGMAVGAKSKNTQVGQAATKKLKSKSGGRILLVLDKRDIGLREKLM